MEDFRGPVSRSSPYEVGAVDVLDILDALELASESALSEEALETVVEFVLGTNPILSSPADGFIAGMDGFRKRPLIEARDFSGRDESVLLPDLAGDVFATGLIGLGDLSRMEDPKLGDGNLEGPANGWFVLILDGVFRDLVVGFFSGV